MSEDPSGEAATPFHPGELTVQERLGYREKVARYGSRMMRESLIAQHAEFFAALPWVVVGSLDGAGRPRACPKAGLLFVDFAVGDLLMTTGAAEILWDERDPDARPPVERRLRIGVEQVRRIRNGLPATWCFEDLAADAGGPGG